MRIPDEITDEREELYAEIERLSAINAALLAAAKEVIALTMWSEDGFDHMAAHAYIRLRTAIAKAEEPAP